MALLQSLYIVTEAALAIAPLEEYLHRLTLRSLRQSRAAGVVSLLRSSQITFHILPSALRERAGAKG